MPEATLNHSTSRRGSLAGIAALSGVGPALALSPVLAASDADAELIDLCELFHRQHEELARMDDAPFGSEQEARADALNGDRWTTAWLVEQTWPETARGHRMKAGVAAVMLAENQGDEPDDPEIRMALVTLREMADGLRPSA